jgi:hypothetical protein
MLGGRAVGVATIVVGTGCTGSPPFGGAAETTVGIGFA